MEARVNVKDCAHALANYPQLTLCRACYTLMCDDCCKSHPHLAEALVPIKKDDGLVKPEQDYLWVLLDHFNFILHRIRTCLTAIQDTLQELSASHPAIKPLDSPLANFTPSCVSLLPASMFDLRSRAQ